MLHQCNVFEQLIQLRPAPEKSIHEHINAFSKIYQDIKSFPHIRDLPDAIWVTRFLRSLPLEYAAFARSYDKELQTTKLNDVFGALRSEFDNRATTTASSMPSATANFASTSSKPKPTRRKGNRLLRHHQVPHPPPRIPVVIARNPVTRRQSVSSSNIRSSMSSITRHLLANRQSPTTIPVLAP